MVDHCDNYGNYANLYWSYVFILRWIKTPQKSFNRSSTWFILKNNRELAITTLPILSSSCKLQNWDVHYFVYYALFIKKKSIQNKHSILGIRYYVQKGIIKCAGKLF